MTSSSTLVDDFVLARRVAAATGGLRSATDAVLTQLAERFPTDLPPPPAPPAGGTESPFDGAVTAATAIGAGVAQLARLAEVDVNVASSAFEVPPASVHAVVISALLQASRRPHADLETIVVHESVARPRTSSVIIPDLVSLSASRAILDAGVAAATERAGRLQTSLTELNKELRRKDLDPDQRQALTADLDETQALLADIAALSARAAAVAKEQDELITYLTTPAAPGGRSPLSIALTLEDLPSTTAILVVSGAKAQTHQMTVARRILFPRVQVTASVAFDWYLNADDSILDADRATGAIALHAKVGRAGAGWNEVGGWRGAAG